MAAKARWISSSGKREVLEAAGQIFVVGGHVEMAVAREVEEDRALDPFVVRRHRAHDGAVDRVGRLWRRDDPLAAGKSDR